MANQHDKVQLFIAEDSIEDESLLIKKLSIATIDSIKDILPKDIETMNGLINKVKSDIWGGI